MFIEQLVTAYFILLFPKVFLILRPHSSILLFLISFPRVDITHKACVPYQDSSQCHASFRLFPLSNGYASFLYCSVDFSEQHSCLCDFILSV